MEIGVILPNTGPLGAAEGLFAIADRAETLGLDSLWAGDHLALPVDPHGAGPSGSRGGHVRIDPDTPIMDALTVLASVAARTERIALGVSVLILPVRHPLHVAKTATTVDRLSGGRLRLGVGLGWLEEEYRSVGIPWEQRGALLDEQIRLLRELWTSDRPEFHGAFYDFEGMGLQPKPVNGTVPILVGGNTKRAMRRAAASGDGWHLSNLTPAEVEGRIELLRQECADIDRDPETVLVSKRAQLRLSELTAAGEGGGAVLAGTLEQVVQRLLEYRRIGVREVALAPPHSEMDLLSYLRVVEVIAKEIRPAVTGAG